ncbi:PDZ domain-containing protein [Cryobacterium sp. TMT2-10]|uniref:PDZ domain-containing protein n=1 Tax=Cryobacterium shii TaxID=1259235 RepID=A0AAQ2C7B1_9MICO|nr:MULTISPECIES: trypsin-like peptidase domain-containing protein [Cryobacterium]TFC50186.1 PDZ domain-containing protein [Cryobacterium shii]TFD40067.1 PDZ domain-containing protein [Cryobacterium sp. TMT2-10]
MTDNTQEPGKTPDHPHGSVPFEVNSVGETTSATDASTTSSSSAEPAAGPTVPASTPGRAADDQSTEVIQPASTPAAAPAAATAAAGPAAAPAGAATVAQPTLAYATDAFGRPLPGGAGSTPNYAPNGAPQTYAHENGYPNQQAGGIPQKDQQRSKGSIALIAALAIGALLGGASGAGVTAFVLTNQSSGIPADQATGPQSVVVNNTDSVNQITAVAAKASPSVVTIDASSGSSGGTGSGVVLTQDGYVLTNTHVVTLDGAAADATLQVTGNDGKLYAATIVGTDPVSDLAVVKLTDAKGLTPIDWADSSKLNVGDTTIAIGAPLGLSGTVTDGIVSALNRSISIASSAAPDTQDNTAPNDQQSPFFFDLPDKNGSQEQAPTTSGSISLSVIQTDAAINPGNSGGALLNAKGELIGINVAIANAGGSSSSAAGNIGVGFSIPSNLAKRVSEELIKNGTATHGLLGASVTSAAGTGQSDTVGALISEVSSGGAAQKAGLQKGDVVTNFNGVPITDANDLTAQVRALAAGDEAKLTYVRDGKSVTVSVTVGALSS